MSRDVDVLLDLSHSDLSGGELREFVERLSDSERLGAMARRVTCVFSPGRCLQVPPAIPGWSFRESQSVVEPLSEAMANAGGSLVPLLILVGPVDASCEAVAQLRRSLDRDPMFGAALPRVACSKACCLVRLSTHGIGPVTWVPRRVLADLPDLELTAEMTGPCLLLRPEVLANFSPEATDVKNVSAVMLHYLSTARRCGFRTVLCNRAVVRVANLSCDQASRPASGLDGQDEAILRARTPDFERSWHEFRSGSWERFEALHESVLGHAGSFRRSLLLDVRNVFALFNGTTHAVLSTVDALKQRLQDWEVSVLANPEGAAFHELGSRYADWPLYTTVPDRTFTAALRLAQPWHIRDMLDLHRLSLFNAYLMLDTITWDIVYLGPARLEGTWQFLADHADGLLFDSDFTRQRFVERFPAGRQVPSLVTHFSLDPDDYVRKDVPSCNDKEDFILVVGNDLDHKDVRQTVETLATAFPFRSIVALGPTSVVSASVTTLRSGLLPELDLHRLYACATYVVFPSFYEGFGFPIVTALAYGRTVLARRSALVEELAAHCVKRGRLLLFNRREELATLIGRLVHGDPVSEQPLGQAIENGAPPRNWHRVAEEIDGFLQRLVEEPSRSRWITREHIARQLLAYRS
jgi:glycosyltransferase involved in cell wall biosynthesis